MGMQGVGGSNPLSSTGIPKRPPRGLRWRFGCPARAQLVAAAFDGHAGGRGFESPQLHRNSEEATAWVAVAFRLSGSARVLVSQVMKGNPHFTHRASCVKSQFG